MSTEMRVVKYLKNNLRGKVSDGLFLDILESAIILMNYKDKVYYKDMVKLVDGNEKVIDFMVKREYLVLLDSETFGVGSEFYSMMKRADQMYYEKYDVVDVF